MMRSTRGWAGRALLIDGLILGVLWERGVVLGGGVQAGPRLPPGGATPTPGGPSPTVTVTGTPPTNTPSPTFPPFSTGTPTPTSTGTPATSTPWPDVTPSPGPPATPPACVG